MNQNSQNSLSILVQSFLMEYLQEATGFVDPVDISLSRLLSLLSREGDDDKEMLVKDYASFMSSQDQVKNFLKKNSILFHHLQLFLNHFNLNFFSQNSSNSNNSYSSSNCNSNSLNSSQSNSNNNSFSSSFPISSSNPSLSIEGPLENIESFLKYILKISWDTIIKKKQLNTLLLLLFLNFRNVRKSSQLLMILSKVLFSIPISISTPTPTSSYNFTNKFYIQELYKSYHSKLKCFSSIFQLVEYILISVNEHNKTSSSPINLDNFFDLVLNYIADLKNISQNNQSNHLFLLQQLLSLLLLSFKEFSSTYKEKFLIILLDLHNVIVEINDRLSNNLFLSYLFIPGDKTFNDKLFQSQSNLISFTSKNQQESIKFWNSQVMETNAASFACNNSSKTFDDHIKSPSIQNLYNSMKQFNIILYECSNSLSEYFLLWIQLNLSKSFIFTLFVEESFEQILFELDKRVKGLCLDFKKDYKSFNKRIEKELKKIRKHLSDKFEDENEELIQYNIQIEIFSGYLQFDSEYKDLKYSKLKTVNRLYETLALLLNSAYKNRLLQFNNFLTMFYMLLTQKKVNKSLIDFFFSKIGNIITVLNYQLENKNENTSSKLSNLLLYSIIYLDILMFILTFSTPFVLPNHIAAYAINKFIQFLHLFFQNFDKWINLLPASNYSQLIEFKRRLIHTFLHVLVHRLYVFEEFFSNPLNDTSQIPGSIDEIFNKIELKSELEDDFKKLRYFFIYYFYYFIYDLSFMYFVYLFVFILPYLSIKLENDNIDLLEYIKTFYLEEKNSLLSNSSDSNNNYYNKRIFNNFFNLSIKSINIIKYNMCNNDKKLSIFLNLFHRYYTYWPSNLSTMHPSIYSISPSNIISIYEKFLHTDINNNILRYYNAEELKNRIQNPYKDYLSQISEDILFNILSYLPYKSVAKFKLLNKKYYLTFASVSNKLWKFHYTSNFQSNFFINSKNNLENTCAFIALISHKFNKTKLSINDSIFNPLLIKINEYNSKQVDNLTEHTKNYCQNCNSQYLKEVEQLLHSKTCLDEQCNLLNNLNIQLNQNIRKDIQSDSTYSKKRYGSCYNDANLQHNWQELFFYLAHSKQYFLHQSIKKKSCPIIGCKKKFSPKMRKSDSLIDHFIQHFNL